MGCTSVREKLENEMMNIQILRLEIQMERYNQLKKLSKLENHKINYVNVIPDYIDPNFAKEHNIYISNNIEEKEDCSKLNKEIIIKRSNTRKSKTKKN